MRENRLHWFENIQRRSKDVLIRRIEGWSQGRLDRGRGRLKKTWIEVIKRDISLSDESMTMDRNK
jgi:hypothetical protein